MNPLPWLVTDGSALFPIIFAAAFLFLSLSTGRRVLSLCGATAQGTHAERGVIAICLGAGILQFVPFSLGLAGQLNVTALRIAAGIVFLPALFDLRAILSGALGMMRDWHSDSRVSAWALALGPAALMATLVALTPSVDPDGLAYHLTVPKRWLVLGHLSYLPTYPYSNAPMGMEMLFTWSMVFAGDSAAKCVHLVMGLLAVMAIYLAGKRLRGPMTGMVPATLFLAGPAGAAVILGCAYVEGGAALATASAALAWLIWYQSDTRGFLRAAALLAGMAVSFKLSAALFPIALGALSFWALYERARAKNGVRPLTASLLSTATLLPLVAGPVIPWLGRAFALTGNPFFPVLASRIPSRDLSPQLAAKVDSYNRYMTWGNAIGRDWSLDQRSHLLLAVSAVLLVIGTFAFFKLRGRMVRAAVIIVTLTALAQLSAAGLYFRYSLPLAAALMLPLIAPFERWLARRPIMIAWIAITLALSLVQARRTLVDEEGNLSGMVATAAGIQDRRTFLQERIPPYPLYETINRQLPADAGVMLSAYCGGFYIDRMTYCNEMVQDSLRFTTWEDFTSDLRRLGITHVVAPIDLATGGPTPFLGGSSVSVITRADQFRLLRLLLTQHARTVQTASDLGLYEIDAAWLKGPESVGAQ